MDFGDFGRQKSTIIDDNTNTEAAKSGKKQSLTLQQLSLKFCEF